MWTDLHEQVTEDLNDLQHDATINDLWEIPEYIDPLRYDEVNDQEWQKHVQMTTPIAPCRDIPNTCLRVKTSRRRWKNQHSEGLYIHVTTQESNSWGDSDYEEMSHNSFEVYDLHAPMVPETPEVIETPEIPIVPEPAKEITNSDIDTSTPKIKTRVQLTLKRKSKNVRGSSDNFVVWDKGVTDMLGLIEPLKYTYPKVSHSIQTVRIQLTEYSQERGEYVKGSSGNVMLHNAEVGVVADAIRSALDELGLVQPGAAPQSLKPPKAKGVFNGNGKSSEEGSRKPVGSLGNMTGAGGLIVQKSKNAKVRVNQNDSGEMILAQLLGKL